MATITIDHDLSVEARIKAAKAALPYRINLHECVIRAHDEEGERMIFGKREYAWKLFQFPKGTSRKMAAYRIRRTGGMPANPAHMLAFAEQAFKDNHNFGEFHSYVVGLGGEMETVLGAQFGGLNFGMCFFFQHVPQNTWTHGDGENTRFLGVRLLSSRR